MIVPTRTTFGFGGQAAYAMKIINLPSYSVFDLPELLELTKRYMSEVDLTETVEFLCLEETANESWNLAINSYVFSELPSVLQIQFSEKVLSKFHPRFMLLIGSRTNLTGRSDGKLTLEQIEGYLPRAIIIEEHQKTSATITSSSGVTKIRKPV